MRRMLGVAVLIVVGLMAAAPAQGQSQHSDNMTLLSNWNYKADDGAGSDLAFWGDRAVLGSYSPGGFWLMDIANPAAPKLLGQFNCPGTQSDVSIWHDLV